MERQGEPRREPWANRGQHYLGMVNFLQKGPGILQFLCSVLVGGWAKAKRLAGRSLGANLTTSPFGTFEFEGQGRLYTWCMSGVQTCALPISLLLHFLLQELWLLLFLFTPVIPLS